MNTIQPKTSNTMGGDNDYVPIASMALAVGPTKEIPCASHAAANPAFSDKNPYPG